MMLVVGPEGWFPCLAVTSSDKSTVSDFLPVCTVTSSVAFTSKNRFLSKSFRFGKQIKCHCL